MGRKTAERLIIELRDKLGKLATRAEDSVPRPDGEEDLRQEALLALTSLGYNRPNAEKALRQVLNEAKGERLSLQSLIKKALRYTSSL